MNVGRENRGFSGGNQMKCYNCQKYGHFAKDCHNSKVDECYSCHQRGHLARDCPEGDRKVNMECHKCHELGHFAKECPSTLFQLFRLITYNGIS